MSTNTDCYLGPDPFKVRQAKSYLSRHYDPRDPDYMEPEEVAKHFGVDVEELEPHYQKETLCL